MSDNLPVWQSLVYIESVIYISGGNYALIIKQRIEKPLSLVNDVSKLYTEVVD